MGKKKVNFVMEEALAEAIRQYKCLYDKTCEEYKGKLAKSNAWKEVANKVHISVIRGLIPYFSRF